MYLAVLIARVGLNFHAIVVTQPGGLWADSVERLPIPLTEKGVVDWLGGADDDGEQDARIQIESHRHLGVREATFFNYAVPPFMDEGAKIQALRPIRA